MPNRSTIPQVFDQHLAFAALESGLFSLAQPRSYLALNDPTAKDTDVEAAVSGVVDGLFAVLATMGVVPIIRCPKVGFTAGSWHIDLSVGECRADMP